MGSVTQRSTSDFEQSALMMNSDLTTHTLFQYLQVARMECLDFELFHKLDTAKSK